MLLIFWSILCESAVFILLGFLLAGMMKVLVPAERVTRHLSTRRFRSVMMATVVGAPLPLCSCSVLPTALTLRRKGASRGATLAFLISTPETSVTSVLLTYSLLGPVMAVFRPVAACITAIVAGLLENVLDRRGGPPEPDEAAADAPPTDGHAPAPPTDPGIQSSRAASRASLKVLGAKATADSEMGQHGDESESRRHGPAPTARERARAGLHFAFVELFDDLFGWVLVGILAAAVLQSWLPQEVLARVLGGPLQSMLLMVLIGVPLYVCAEASTPIAAALIAQGVNPGAALVLLLVGPATNIGAIGLLYRQLGRRTVAVYLTAIVVVAIFMGAVLNDLFRGSELALQQRALGEPLVPYWIKTAGAIAFLALGGFSARRLRYLPRLAAWISRRTGRAVSVRGLAGAGAVLAAAFYATSGFVAIGPAEVGLVRRFGAIHGDGLLPGLHYALPYPIDRVDRVRVKRVERLLIGFARDRLGNLAFQSDPVDAWHLTGDENIADIQMAVHWSIRPDQVVEARYGVRDQAGLVRSIVIGAAREVWAGSAINTVMTTERRNTGKQIERLAQQRLDACGSGLRVDSLHVLHAHAPVDVHAAFRDVASALEDRAARIDQARTNEARIVPQARGEAGRRVAQAQGYAATTVHQARGGAARFLALQPVYAAAPEVTGRRLELEMLENVLPKLRKYLKPPTETPADVQIWFVSPEAAGETPLEPLEGQ